MPGWHSTLSRHISQFTSRLADIWVTSNSQLESSGVVEFFHPSALHYRSKIYLTIIPTERYPCLSEALPISLELESAEYLLPRNNSQLLLTGATLATYIFKAFSLIGTIHISDKGLHANLSDPAHHSSGKCARDEITLYQCYWKNRRFPQCSVHLTDWPEAHKMESTIQRPYPWLPLVQAWSEAT